MNWPGLPERQIQETLSRNDLRSEDLRESSGDARSVTGRQRGEDDLRFCGSDVHDPAGSYDARRPGQRLKAKDPLACAAVPWNESRRLKLEAAARRQTADSRGFAHMGRDSSENQSVNESGHDDHDDVGVRDDLRRVSRDGTQSVGASPDHTRRVEPIS